MRKLTLQALAQPRENSGATSKFLSFNANLAAPLSWQSYELPRYIELQSRHDENHPNAIIQHFKTLLDIMQDSINRLATFRSTEEYIKHKSLDKDVYIGLTTAPNGALCLPWY